MRTNEELIEEIKKHTKSLYLLTQEFLHNNGLSHGCDDVVNHMIKAFQQGKESLENYGRRIH